MKCKCGVKLKEVNFFPHGKFIGHTDKDIRLGYDNIHVGKLTDEQYFPAHDVWRVVGKKENPNDSFSEYVYHGFA